MLVSPQSEIDRNLAGAAAAKAQEDQAKSAL
jgi:hypothetical protein